MGPKMINLSERDVSDIDIKLLSHGLKFTPTPNADRGNVVADTD
jgi:hypothetical protein